MKKNLFCFRPDDFLCCILTSLLQKIDLSHCLCFTHYLKILQTFSLFPLSAFRTKLKCSNLLDSPHIEAILHG